MNLQRNLQLIDTHAGGDVSRIVTGGVAHLPGVTVRAQMEYLRDRADDLRRLLLEEPYGIPEMSVDLIVPSAHPRAEAGYIIMEVMGYPIYSGSNTICTATALLESGFVPKHEGHQSFLLEAPAGLVEIGAFVKDGTVESITCQGLPSYIDTYHTTVHVPLLGDITYSIAYSGGFYALVDATELGFALTLDEEDRLAYCAHAIVEAIREDKGFSHYELGDVGPLPFLHFVGPVEKIGDGEYRSRSATYVHPGVICRSTTGTGTSARLALMHHEGTIQPGDRLETVSLRGTSFVGEFTHVSEGGARDVINNTITGRAYVLARSEIVANSEDPMIAHLELGHVLGTAPPQPQNLDALKPAL